MFNCLDPPRSGSVLEIWHRPDLDGYLDFRLNSAGQEIVFWVLHIKFKATKFTLVKSGRKFASSHVEKTLVVITENRVPLSDRKIRSKHNRWRFDLSTTISVVGKLIHEVLLQYRTRRLEQITEMVVVVVAVNTLFPRLLTRQWFRWL